jgi:DNA-directed RNA polymerase subunit RPC12/RpoP
MSRYVCPDCYRPINQPKRGKDARCQPCRDELPVNGRWPWRQPEQ